MWVAAPIFTNTHDYAFGGNPTAVVIQVDVFDLSGQYKWQYTVTNNSYDPSPGTSNGFSGFETALPAAVPDLGNLTAPGPGWVFNCCSGEPVEYDKMNSAGLGIMPGQSGVFSFTSLAREITQSTGWFHTWESGTQTNIVNYGAGNGVEVPNVLKPPIPEPTTLALLGVGVIALSAVRRLRTM